MYPADQDLTLAAKAIDRMADTTSLVEYVSSWEDFLIRLERAWEKCDGEARTRPTARSWKQVMDRLRRKDSLLRYLKQARNAETHAVDQSLGAPIQVSIADRYGRPFHADAIQVSVRGQTLEINIDSMDIGLDWSGNIEPSDPQLLRIKTNAGWFNPPTEHLGNRIIDRRPVSVALLGLHFYRGARQSLLEGRTPDLSIFRTAMN